MISSKKNFILLVFLLGCITEVFAKEYFVSLVGNDFNNGSILQPLKSIEKASEIALPGDSIIIRQGIYVLQKPFEPYRSGTKNNYITYTAYPNEKVIFDGAQIIYLNIQHQKKRFSKLNQGLFQIENKAYLKFEHIELRNSQAAGYLVRGPANNIQILNCVVNNTHNSGIGLWYCDSVIVKGCEVIAANNNAQEFYEEDEKPRVEAPHEAISICGAKYFDVSYNLVHDCYKEGIDCKEISRHGKIYKNTIYNMPRQALYVDAWFGLLEDVELFENKIYNCMWGFGISVEGENSKVNDIRFHHNLIYNTKAAGLLFGIWGSDGLRSNIYIYNNTFYKCGSPEVYSGGVGSMTLLSKNFSNVFIYRNLCDKGWDFELGFTFNPLTIQSDLKARNFIAAENLFESKKNRPSRAGQFGVIVQEYLPDENLIGSPLYLNELQLNLVPEKIPPIENAIYQWKYKPSQWYGALEPINQKNK